MQKEEQVSFLAEKIRQADAVLIGGGSGLSSAAGYNHYHWLPYMEECLQDFKEWYGLKSPFDGFYYCYSSPEQQWAYYARYIQSMWDAPTGQPYYDLRDIVAEKEVFVLTTNIDMQFERIFQKERICDYQGNSGYVQCSQPCHDQIYSNVEMIRRMNENIRELRVTSELLPRCNECGRIMVPWVRDDTFLERKDWREGVLCLSESEEILNSRAYKRQRHLYSRRFGRNPAGFKRKHSGKGNVMKMNVYQEISQIIKEADGILIGASNGLSIAEGYNIFADDAWFQENMGDFRDKYGLRCVLHGFSVPMKVEEKWAFVSRLVKAKAMQDEPSEIMKNIYALVKDKEYFVVTSNAEDHFVPVGFEADRVFEMEGKLTQMRCKNRCHDEVYPNQKAVLAMTEEEVNGRVPKELLPKCPKCGGDMEVNWGEMSSFTETKNWKEKAACYQEFIQNLHGKKLVILEFGIGWRNQMIKAPLMQLAAVEPQARYITFNKGEIYIPEEIKEKSIGVDGNLTVALKEIRKEI